MLALFYLSVSYEVSTPTESYAGFKVQESKEKEIKLIKWKSSLVMPRKNSEDSYQETWFPMDMT